MTAKLMNLETMCRICSVVDCTENDFTPIFDGESSCKSSRPDIYSEMVSFNLGLAEEDGLPQKMCSKCLKIFLAITQFRIRCKQVQAKLKRYFYENRYDENEDNAKIGAELSILVDFGSNLEFDGRDEDKDRKNIKIEGNELNWKSEYCINTSNTAAKAAEDWNNIRDAVKETEHDDVYRKCGDSKVLFDNQAGRCKSDDEEEFKDIIFHHIELSDTRNTESVVDVAKDENEKDDWDDSVEDFWHESESSSDETEEINSSCLTDSNKENSKKKTVDTNVNSKYSCKTCGKDYHYARLLARHVKTCSKNTCVGCKICTIEFESDELLKKHMTEIHPNGGQPMCPICSNTFRTARIRDVHIRTVHSKPEEHKCDVCNRIFISKRLVSNHKSRYHSVGNYECSICHEKFTKTSKYKYHLLTHDENKKFKCQYCGKPFPNLHYATVHERSHTGERPHLCSTCGLTFRYDSEFKKHLNTHITDYICEHCGKYFSTRRKLKSHNITKHNLGNQHECDICGKKFRKWELKIHKSVVHNETSKKIVRSYPFNCPICSKGFLVAPSLAAHVKIHTEDRRHVCKECGSGFKRADHLQLHIKRMHLGITLHACEVCGKKFLERCALNSHMICHTDETPFQCPQCPCTFKRKCSLRIHMRKHTGERPFPCGICNMRFQYRHMVVLHTQTHSKDQIKTVEEEARLTVENAVGTIPANNDVAVQEKIELLDG